jgi:lipid A ethanolaminephosphotransferase
MMGNVFNTQFSEASGFFSLAAVLYVLFLGVIPCIFIFAAKTDFGSFKRFMANIGLALGIAVGIAFVNIQNWPWIDRNSTELGSLLMPWSYTVNTVRFYNGEKKRNQKEILLPDAQISNDSKDVCILIIGESARRDHFSLYGYEKPTNPLLAEDDVTALIANSAATYTTAGVKAILDHQPTGKLYEILPNYMYRTGVDVIWRTSNWGEPPVHIEKYHTVRDLKKMYPDADDRYDGILLTGLKEEIMSSEKDKILVILHTNTSHGPTYNKKYPAEFERFTPVCTTVEMSKANPQELMNAYDNSVLYTDYLIHSAIEILKEIPDRRACMLYVSDHGESLGEGNLYMHGVPMSIAPKEQVEIPFIVWTSIDAAEVKELDEVGQYHVFHSVMDFLGVESPVFDEDKNIFR